ncbi:MAG: right-handed parallel beta-helix repeat-containing protein [Planctomycetota bacterium]|jgi:parallel beta-helix repeat protein
MKQKCRHATIVVLFLLAAAANPALGIRYIPDDLSIGVWDDVSRIYTLTTDVYETIQIEQDNLTLDGAGYTVEAGALLYGVYLPARTGVTVRNVNVQGCYIGIYLYSGSGNTVINNTAADNYIGIDSYCSGNCTVTNNAASANGVGIWLSHSSNSLVANNTATDNYGGGIYLFLSEYSTMKDNTAFDNNVAMSLHTAHNNTVTGNTTSDNKVGAAIWYSDGNQIYRSRYSIMMGSGTYSIDLRLRVATTGAITQDLIKTTTASQMFRTRYMISMAFELARTIFRGPTRTDGSALLRGRRLKSLWTKSWLSACRKALRTVWTQNCRSRRRL